MTITIDAADLALLNAGKAVLMQPAAVIGPTGPTGPPPASGTYVIYSNGVYNWPGDYNSNAISDYKNVGNQPPGQTACQKITFTAPWGEWLPYSHANPGPFLDISTCCGGGPATRIQFKLKATQPNQGVSLYCVSAGDQQPPPSVPGYVSAPGVFPVGTWVTQTVELSTLGLGPGLWAGMSLYKLGMQDKTGLSSNIIYVDDVLLLP